MKYLVTGAAGFIGSNTVDRLLAQGDRVVGIDNLARKGGRGNLARISTGKAFEFEEGDIRDADLMARVVKKHKDARAVLHLAGQVAVTTSVADPRNDFEVNALGSFNVLEAVRLNAPQMMVLYSSTNKVYGKMVDVRVAERETTYAYADFPNGISEERCLEFHSPYGCSKGAADQYMVDYARIFGTRTITFRQSCIYGHNQFGIEDQGWVAWFIIAALLGRPITVFGDGKQVRDILYVDDLIDCYLAAMNHIDTTAGNAYNIGGGPDNTLSLRQLIAMIEKATGKKLPTKQGDWRPGDQKVFICDISRAKRDFGWSPKIGAQAGFDKLFAWASGNLEVLRAALK